MLPKPTAWNQRMCLPALWLMICLAVCAPSVAQQEAVTTDESVFAPRPHPRLLMTEEDEERLRSRIRDTESLRVLFERVRGRADALLYAAPVRHHKEGRRLLAVSREVLSRVLHLSTAYRITGEDRYAARAVSEMMTAAAFHDWNPSHFLDVAEMTAALAIGYDWLRARLSPQDERVLRAAIVEKGIGPSFFGDHRWVRMNNNWNQVCHGGMTLGALAVFDHEPELTLRVLDRLREGLPHATAAYEPDGIYPEGLYYWDYGTTYQVMLLAALQSALGTDFGLGEAPGFSNTGAFPLHMTGPSGNHFTFGDCGPRHGPLPAVFWFAARRNNPGLTWMERPWLEKLLRGDGHPRNRFLPLLLLWWDGAPPVPPDMPLHWRGDGVNPIAVHRNSWTEQDTTFLAVKAGTPSAYHGHMDIGSFVLEAAGVRWSEDFGAQRYHELEERGKRIWDRTQDSDRWRVYVHHSLSHSTLTVNGQGQVTDASAAIIQFSDDPAFPHTVMDMSPVYAGQLARARRGFSLLPDGRALIQDDITAGEAPARVRWAMTTSADAEFTQPGRAVLRNEGKRMHFEILSPREADVEAFSTDPPNAWDLPHPGTRQVGFHVDLAPGQSAVLGVLLAPEQTESAYKEVFPGRPLDDWAITGFFPLKRREGQTMNTADTMLPDMLRFMDCTLPKAQYIVVHAQRREQESAAWLPVIPDLQCFRSKVVPELRVVLWRKDHLTADYYGEIFTYDDALIRLHMETFPARTAVDPPDHEWDERPDRFRLFQDASAEGDWSLGRILAPVDADLTWRHRGYIHTYICSNWEMYHARTAPRWQDRFLDNAVFLERYGPFSTVFDGPSPEGYAPDAEFTDFDEVIVINQHMENDRGRERFFFARRGDAHYGIVRWDNSVNREGGWVVVERTIGLHLGTQEPEFSFAGMIDRVKNARRFDDSRTGERKDASPSE